ncbi:glucose-6-phosphate 1-dehydrogenase [Alkalibacterium subtropicum]|uniref:Glucose-6-phosphate 1-dehydrogenase n=1 Tax=Alkalibacterium subtropicum TaxID=753702 RepID=A0A1I1LNS9_9LACT|nr:glucose-6-phosphate dehydrogenase [Alkalibacterium subtropicum]SFC74774.1 glucose-6-phosphate 1-dehydrogenase [Alkalibacterium subtropicum]
MSKEKKALYIIFGATGDLASRKLYPALYRLYSKGYLKDHFAVIGTARREWSDEHYQNVVKKAIDDIKESDKDAEDFSSHFRYQSHNVKDSEHYHTLKELADSLDSEYAIEGNRLFYLSMSPTFFGTITTHLRDQELVTQNGFNRVIIEKPFGTDLESSKELNDEINASFDEDQLYRIDHYLGKEMVQTILALRFSNRIIQDSWTSENLSSIQITLAENLGVEERGEYYDKSGALRDMVQNHVLQIVSLLTMDEPESFSTENVRKEKLALLESLKQPNVKDEFVRGQYQASEDGDCKAYRDEEKVDPDSLTETFVAGKVVIDSDKWRNVPIYIRTGKRMKEKTSRIDVLWKKTDQQLFDESDSLLTIHISPKEGLELQLNDKEIGPGMHLRPVTLSSMRSEETIRKSPEAYEKLLLDVLNGDETHFAHWGEVAASWKYVDHIRQAWNEDLESIPFYPAHSMGPKESDELLAKDGQKWLYNPKD